MFGAGSEKALHLRDEAGTPGLCGPRCQRQLIGMSQIQSNVSSGLITALRLHLQAAQDDLLGRAVTPRLRRRPRELSGAH